MYVYVYQDVTDWLTYAAIYVYIKSYIMTAPIVYTYLIYIHGSECMYVYQDVTDWLTYAAIYVRKVLYHHDCTYV